MSGFFLLSFCQFKWLSWGALIWPLLTYLDCVAATSSPISSQTRFNLDLKLSYKTLSDSFWDQPWSASYQFLCYSFLVLLGAVMFTVFLFISSITWPLHVLGCLTDRTSETCIYLKDFSEISPSHIDLCIKLKKDECRLDGVAIELQCAPFSMCSSIKSNPVFSLWRDAHEMTSKTYCNEMQSNWSQYECNVC